jgi:hypothetical protein
MRWFTHPVKLRTCRSRVDGSSTDPPLQEGLRLLICQHVEQREDPYDEGFIHQAVRDKRYRFAVSSTRQDEDILPEMSCQSYGMILAIS